MSSSVPIFPGLRRQVSVSTFKYPQTPPPLPDISTLPDGPPLVSLTEEALDARIAQARAAGAAEAEARLRKHFEERADREADNVAAAIRTFEDNSKKYYARVELEVVTLALSIAAKILHRESQVDPQLVAALVQMALKQMKEGSAVSVRVRPENAGRWREHLAALKLNVTVTVVEDSTLEPDDCILESELGTANFSLESQLKEVERGFFDVLAQKPQA